MLNLFRRQEQRTPLSALLRLIILLLFGHLWWTENVVYGNAVSLRALGWFASTYGPLRDYALPALPSIFQLFITEDFGGILGTPAMGFVSVIFAILDVIGPAYGWLIRNGITSPTLWQVAQALVRGAFVSLLAQHLAWVNLKWLWRYLWEDLLWGKPQPAVSANPKAPGKRSARKAARVVPKAGRKQEQPVHRPALGEATANGGIALGVQKEVGEPEVTKEAEPAWDGHPSTVQR